MPEPLPILDSRHTSSEPSAPERAREKSMDLLETLRPLVREGALVAFSGGVDSAYLLWAARKTASEEEGARVLALTTTSASTSTGDLEDAKAFTRTLGLRHVWRESRELELPDYARNDSQRCYHCKVELFRIARDVAREEDLRWILYGYNDSDRGDVRPGHRAAQEADVLFPLADAGLTKGDIRFLMEEAGLPLAGKPASPCLSSRITTGIPVTQERLGHVEAMEGILRRAGISTLRVRICQDEGGSPFLRVEVDPGEFEKVLACRAELHEAGLARGYRWVTLDLGGYRMGGGVT